ncbi:MAG: glycosyltransferase family 2 protein [Sulfitobacter sp.]
MLKWGLTATIKAPAADILRFAAYHLAAGAHRLYLCLDAPCPQALPFLENHPKIRVTTCDAAHWQRINGGRPDMHQPRQTLNATHIYHRARDVDWLIHMDVDEFLVAQRPIAENLAALPAGTQVARARPMELLSGGTDAFKRFIPPGPDRDRITSALYPVYGEYLKGGFLSHVAGKVFVATGMENLKFRIHNVMQNGVQNPNEQELSGVDLAHCHAHSWEDWQTSFAFRLAQGSYRADLGPTRARAHGGITMHELFNAIISEEGPDGLRNFYNEVCADTPQLRARLAEKHLLTVENLKLDATMAQHFPDYSQK